MLFWVWTNTLGSKRAARLHYNKRSERTPTGMTAESAERRKMWLEVSAEIMRWGSLARSDPGEEILALVQVFPTFVSQGFTILKIRGRMTDAFQFQPGGFRSARARLSCWWKWTTLSKTANNYLRLRKSKDTNKLWWRAKTRRKSSRGWTWPLFSWQPCPEHQSRSRSRKGGAKGNTLCGCLTRPISPHLAGQRNQAKGPPVAGE